MTKYDNQCHRCPYCIFPKIHRFTFVSSSRLPSHPNKPLLPGGLNIESAIQNFGFTAKYLVTLAAATYSWSIPPLSFIIGILKCSTEGLLFLCRVRGACTKSVAYTKISYIPPLIFANSKTTLNLSQTLFATVSRDSSEGTERVKTAFGKKGGKGFLIAIPLSTVPFASNRAA